MSQINQKFRQHFPFFRQSPDWAYLDSAATTLKPQVLIDATQHFYSSAGSVHRSQYDLSQTQQYEQARSLVAERFNAKREEVIWTSGTTHSLNLVAYGLEDQIQAGDEIVISVAEHHANFIPWQQLAKHKQAKLIVLPLNADYQIDQQALTQVLSARTKIVAFNLVSNVTGIRQPAEQIVAIIREHSSAQIVVDMAQAVCSEQVYVQQIGADFYAFSAHKMYGPNGVGILIGKFDRLQALKPLFYGGKMLANVTETSLTLAELPYRLEAGTPNIAGIISFGEVLQWLKEWDFEALNQSLYQLAENTRKRLKNYKIAILGSQHSPTISFVIEGVHHADLSAFFTESKVAIRSGEHCAKPYLRYLNQAGTVRLSLSHYNTDADVEQFFTALDKALAILLD